MKKGFWTIYKNGFTKIFKNGKEPSIYFGKPLTGKALEIMDEYFKSLVKNNKNENSKK